MYFHYPGISGLTERKCSFEDNLCGFRHDAGDRWRWVVVKGNNSAEFHRQRPQADHKGSKEGWLKISIGQNNRGQLVSLNLISCT